ncbi:MAG: cytochrome c oxidase subunit 3 [Sphingobacteriales bacterium]|nr:cytochrome c oxidase subunit 3 [Sphingobacteriales bacterium]MCC7224121.1 cytochrome c oxidase subunit 3 [Chitinophagales bacterium]
MSNTISTNQVQRIHPQKFMLWAAIGSICMMFAALTSAFIVREAQGNWVEFKLPNLFFISTAIIGLSSWTLIQAQQAYQHNKHTRYRSFMRLTAILGLGFALCQYMGWQQMMQNGILLQGNPSGSFVYLISGLHALHVIAGVVILLVMWFNARQQPDEVQQLVIDSNPYKMLHLDMIGNYWHFVGILWLYLLVFFAYFFY